MGNTCYKAVFCKRDNQYESLLSLKSSSPNADQRISAKEYSLEYKLGEKTKPRVASAIFAFDTLASAIRFIHLNEFGKNIHILKCKYKAFNEKPNKVCGCMCYSGIESFWNHHIYGYPLEHYGCNLINPPSGTILCKWVTPITSLGNWKSFRVLL